jgi:hypothetical protein
MPKIVITGIPGLDGEYDLDMTFTHRDFHTIKQVAGVRANEVQDALEGGDLDIVVALAEIALRRAEVVHSVDQLWDAEAGGITLDVTDVEQEPDDPSMPGDEPRSDSAMTSSGDGTNGATEHSQATSIIDSSGTPPQGLTSDPLTSAI